MSGYITGHYDGKHWTFTRGRHKTHNLADWYPPMEPRTIHITNNMIPLHGPKDPPAAPPARDQPPT